MSFEYNDESFSVLKRALGGDWYLTIFDNVKTVADGAFKDNHNIHELTFSNTERTIGKAAFENCSSLRIVHLGVVPEVPDYAFANCQSLEGVSIVPTIRRIGDNAFLNCKNLRHIHLWNCINYISDTAFNGCDSLVCYVGKQSYAERYCREHNIRYRTAIVDDIEDNLLREYTWLMGVDDVENYNPDENISFADRFKVTLNGSSIDNCKNEVTVSFDNSDKGGSQLTDFTINKDDIQGTNITNVKDKDLSSGTITQSANGGIENGMKQSSTEICKDEVSSTDFTMSKNGEVDSSNDNSEDTTEQTFDTVYEDRIIGSSIEDYEDSHGDSLLDDYEDGESGSLFEDYENDSIESDNEDADENGGIEPYFCSDIDKNNERSFDITVDDVFVPVSEVDNVSEIEPYIEPTMALDCEDEKEPTRNIVNEPYSDDTSMNNGISDSGEAYLDIGCEENAVVEVENELTADDEDEPYYKSNLTVAEGLGSEIEIGTEVTNDETVIIFNGIGGSEEVPTNEPSKMDTKDESVKTPLSIMCVNGGKETENNRNLNSENTSVTEESDDEMKKSKHRDKRSVETYDQLVLVEDLDGNVLTDVQIKPVEQHNLNRYKNSDETGVYYITPDTKRSEFNGNRNIKELRVVEGVVEIPQWVAAYCPNLTTLVLAPSVKKIGAYAFYGSTNLKCLIDNACDTLTMEVGRDAFKGCRYRMGSTEK